MSSETKGEPGRPMAKPLETEDHRTRVGAERRQRMTDHLLERSLGVFAEQGMDASVDAIISAAGVSRGTFYNYFQTNHDVASALGAELAKELINLVEATVGAYADPVQRVGVGVRLFLHAMRERRQVASFVWRTSAHAPTVYLVLQGYLPKHIDEGVAAGKFEIKHADTGIQVVAGVVLAGTYALSNLSVAADYPEEVTRCALLALGAKRRHADKIVALKLPRFAVPEGSLLARTRPEARRS